MEDFILTSLVARKFKTKEDLDKVVSEYNKKVDELKALKEKEITTI